MSPITTHVLDTALGKPAAGINLSLSHLKNPNYDNDQNWQLIATGITNSDGRTPDLLTGVQITSGTYKIRFHTANYLKNHRQPVFYPWVDVVFIFEAADRHHHIPLLLSPFGYSTYRGS